MPTREGVQTRSRANKTDLTYYTTLNAADGDPPDKIQVISKRKLKSDPANHRRLKESFDRIEKERLRKEKEDLEPKSGHKTSFGDHLVLAITHFNVFLYAMGFFIQVGTLPVTLILTAFLCDRRCWIVLDINLLQIYII